MITVISKNRCPQCKMTKRFLNENNIAFEEHNINEEPEYIQKMHEIGISAAPAVLKDGQVLFTGFRPDQLNKLANSQVQ